jgi:hypothetical protein
MAPLDATDAATTPSQAHDPPVATLAEPTITLGLGVRHPKGRRVALAPLDTVADLARTLDEHQGDEAWWSPSVFDGDHRCDAGWQRATVLGVDVDYHDGDGKHVEVPTDAIQRVAQLALPGTLWHPTPRGLRIVALLDETIVDAPRYEQVASAFAAQVADALTGVSGLNVDFGASADHARLLFTPRSTARGVERSAETIVIGGTVSVASLTAGCPLPRPKAASAGPRGSSPRTGGGVLTHAFAARDWLGREVTPGKYTARCPWSDGHSCGTDLDTSTVIYAPSEGSEIGAFFCLHDSCRGRTLAEVLACFTSDELRRAREAAGVAVDASARDFGEALKMIRTGASDEQIVKMLRVRAPRREPPSEYARRTLRSAREVHERRLSHALVTRLFLEASPANGTQPALAVLKLTLGPTVDGEVLPRAKIVVPSPGYESARDRYEAVAADLDAARLLAGDVAHARELLGRPVEVVVRDGRIVWIRASGRPSLRDGIRSMLETLADAALTVNVRDYLEKWPEGVFEAHARLVQIIRDRNGAV